MKQTYVMNLLKILAESRSILSQGNKIGKIKN